MKPSARPAVEIAELCSLSEPARRLLDPRLSAGAFHALLRQHRLFNDAVSVAAQLLPKREAVWWGCLCAWQAYRTGPPEKELPALQATVRWVHAPSEENRRALDAAKDGAGMETPAGALSGAAFFSPAAPGQPGSSTTARLVSGAVLLVCTRVPVSQRQEALSHFLDLAREVAEDRLSWQLQPGGSARNPG